MGTASTPAWTRAPIPGIREMRLLEPDSPPGEQLTDLGEEVSRGLDEGHAIDLSPPCRVAEVRVERGRRVRLYENRGIRALEPRQVADVRLTSEDVRRPGDEQRLVEDARKSLDTGHARFFTRNSRASRYPFGPFPMILASTTPSSTDMRRHSSRSSMFERCTSTTGTVKSSIASRIAHE